MDVDTHKLGNYSQSRKVSLPGIATRNTMLVSVRQLWNQQLSNSVTLTDFWRELLLIRKEKIFKQTHNL